MSGLDALPDRFRAKIEVQPDGCWHWIGGRSGAGYGQIKWNGRSRPAHRFVYELLVGPIPHGLEIDHLCKTKRCVNPDHLEPVTHLENMRRSGLHSLAAANVTKTHCAQGHPFSEANTYVYANGKRACRTCRPAWKTRSRARLRAAA